MIPQWVGMDPMCLVTYHKGMVSKVTSWSKQGSGELTRAVSMGYKENSMPSFDAPESLRAVASLIELWQAKQQSPSGLKASARLEIIPQ